MTEYDTQMFALGALDGVAMGMMFIGGFMAIMLICYLAIEYFNNRKK
jgi:hypothetical protein